MAPSIPSAMPYIADVGHAWLLCPQVTDQLCSSKSFNAWAACQEIWCRLQTPQRRCVKEVGVYTEWARPRIIWMSIEFYCCTFIKYESISLRALPRVDRGYKHHHQVNGDAQASGRMLHQTRRRKNESSIRRH
eukprot:scaffold191005_cov23-Tisochrysis_lutea.AAC.1